MAKIEIESAFVEAWSKNDDQHPAWGMKTAEPHSKKNEAGKFEAVGRTFRTVKVSRASGIDLTEFRKGDRVQVWGKEVTESREYEANGAPKKAYDLIVWADRIERVGSPTQAEPSADVWNAGPVVDAWNADSEVPF